MIINSLGNKKVIEFSKLNKKKYREQNNEYLIIGMNAIAEAKNIRCEITTNLDYESENEIMCIIDATKLRQSILANLPKKRKNRLSSNDTDNQCKKNKYNEILKKYNSTEKNHFNSIN